MEECEGEVGCKTQSKKYLQEKNKGSKHHPTQPTLRAPITAFKLMRALPCTDTKSMKSLDGF